MLTAVNQRQLFEPHKPLAIFVEFDMDSLLQFPPHLRTKSRLLVFKGVRLVINQSVWIQWSGVYTQRSELFIRWLFLRLYLLYYVHYVIKRCYLITPLLCSYMWDLFLKTHIWCASGFVLKTRCHMCWVVLIQKSKGFKNHLKMNLENLFGKRKVNSFPFPLPSSFLACWPSFPRRPARPPSLLPFLFSSWAGPT